MIIRLEEEMFFLLFIYQAPFLRSNVASELVDSEKGLDEACFEFSHEKHLSGDAH